MNSNTQYLVQWNKTKACDSVRMANLIKKQDGQRLGTGCTVVDDFKDIGFAVAALIDEPYIGNHLSWTHDFLVLISGTPLRSSGTIWKADDIVKVCEDGPQGLTDLLPTMRGGFSVVAFFRRHNQLLVARDRFGLVPVFYAAEKLDRFLSVSVGTGPLTTARSQGAVVPNMSMLGRYVLFRYGEVYGHEETFIENTFSVNPATVIEMREDIIQRKYWSFSDLDRTLWTDEDTLEERCLKHLLDSVDKCVFKNISTAIPNKTIIALSSGMDSSSVAAACFKLGQPLPAFTAKYDVYSPINEFEAAERIAQNVCQNWIPVVIGADEFLNNLKNAYSIHEFPLATSAYLGYDILFKKIADAGYNTIVSGDSGDDLFAGNYPCYLHNLADLFVGRSARFGPEFRAWIKLHSTTEFPKDIGVFWNFLASQIDLSDPGTVTPKPLLLDKQVTRTDYLMQAALSAPGVRVNAGGYLQSYTAYGIWFSNKQPGVLPESESSWHFGLDYLDPFMDEDFFKFTWKLPSEWKIKNGYNKVLLRRVMRGLLPKDVTGTEAKIGFNVPFQQWSMRKSYKEFLSDVLKSEDAKDIDSIVDIAKIRETVIGQPSRPLSSMLLWQTVNAILWLHSIRT
jgi:asparagine synthase (glutamine-hydrolysing)